MRQRIGRVGRDRLLEQRRGLGQTFLVALVPEETPSQVQVMRFRIGRRLGDQARPSDDQPGLQRVDDGARQLVFDGKDVLQLAVVDPRPEMISVQGADQLGGNTQLIAVPAYAPFQHRRDVELLTDLPDVDVLSFEGEGRGPRDDPQALDVCERVDDLLRDAVGEVFVLLVPGQVHEWQYGDGRRLRRGRRASRSAANDEIPEHSRCRCEGSDGDERQGEANAADAATGRGGSPLDAPATDVEDPGEGDDDRKPRCKRHDHVGEHRLRPVEPVRDGLDDLEHRERGNAVSDQRAEDAPPLELCKQGHVHLPGPPDEERYHADGQPGWTPRQAPFGVR